MGYMTASQAAKKWNISQRRVQILYKEGWSINMNGNLTYQEEPREELLNGKIYMMSNMTKAAKKICMKLE